MILQDIKNASNMASENIFNGILGPAFLISIFTMPAFLFLIPGIESLIISVPVTIIVISLTTALYAASFAQIPLKGRVKNAFLNILRVTFSHPFNAILYPLYLFLAALLMFPLTLFFIGSTMVFGNIAQTAMENPNIWSILPPLLGQTFLTIMSLGGINAAALAMWGYYQLPPYEGQTVAFSLLDLITIAVGAGLRGTLAAIIVFPVLFLFIIEVYYLVQSINTPSLLLVLLTFFTGLIAVVATAIPLLSGISFLRRTAFLEKETDEDIYTGGYDKPDDDFTIWRD